uniref:RRM domain-containing protein n=1 Tax=Anopheles farauti TaxID=69004 RepID=A0A182QSG2_9DIPT
MPTEKGWENTLRIDMSQLPERPKESEIIALLGKIVLPSDGLVRAHLNAVLFHVYIQMKTMEQAKNFVERNRGKHGITIGGVRHLYDIELVDGAVDENYKIFFTRSQEAD